MIIIVPVKDFTKHAKKLVEPKPYLIIDGTGMDSGPLVKYSQVVTLEGFNPPGYLINAKKNEDDVVDSQKFDKIKKKYFKSKSFKVGLLGALNGFIQGDGKINIFIVLNQKAYKYFSKEIKKRFEKYFKTEYQFIFRYDDIQESKKILNKNLKSKKVAELQQLLKKYEKTL